MPGASFDDEFGGAVGYHLAGRPSIDTEDTSKPPRPNDSYLQLAAAIKASDPLPDLDDLPPVPRKTREKLLDRIEAGLREGLFEMSPECYQGFLCCIMPDEFQPPPVPAKPTGTAPKTRERERVYAARVRAAVTLFHKRDRSDTLTGPGLVAAWPIGRSPKIKGWVGDKPPRKRK